MLQNHLFTKTKYSMKYKLATSTWGKEEIKAINSVIENDMYSMGEKVSLYEKDFASYFLVQQQT